MPNEPFPARIALTTVSSLDQGRQLARHLVERRLAACVNLIPGLTSVYRWQGAVEEAEETLLLIKTTEDRLPALQAAVEQLHSYDVPEFLALPVKSGSQPYLDWLLDSVKDSVKQRAASQL
ncbi:MAG: divalent-cation tolerance protein CutA [Acidobacteriaceae bacterium]